LIKFILNNTDISTSVAASVTLLEFIRYHRHLTGTKTGCNEGDCGACTVLVGEIMGDGIRYRSFTSCLTPLENIHSKHVVTVEGINMEGLNPIQQFMYEESGTQCGFCTPGFVVSMAGFCLSGNKANAENARAAVDGNICRCTGYKSIERATAKLAGLMLERQEQSPVDFVTEKGILPAYFKDIPARLGELKLETNGVAKRDGALSWMVGGGTDLYVQKHDEIREADIVPVFDHPELNGITRHGNECVIGAAATVTDLLESEIMQEAFPNLEKHVKLVSSTAIRNMATIAGNFINASPIGDFTIFFLALDAKLTLTDGENEREIPLRKLYKGYKQLDKSAEEWVKQIRFELPKPSSYFNFEKVSKRTNLDIASVNTAFYAEIDGGVFMKAWLSAGGVGPVPMFLKDTSAFLVGKPISIETVEEAISIVMSEISPISDARGAAVYKRLLLGQLIKAHFVECFPKIAEEILLQN
jgi:xanthine dehydrogenase small subunit